MASSDRKSRKMGRKALFELHRNEGKVAAEKRRDGKVVVRPCRKKRQEKRAAARKAVADREAKEASDALAMGIVTTPSNDDARTAATIARAAVDVAAHEAGL